MQFLTILTKHISKRIFHYLEIVLIEDIITKKSRVIPGNVVSSNDHSKIVIGPSCYLWNASDLPLEMVIQAFSVDHYKKYLTQQTPDPVAINNDMIGMNICIIKTYFVP